MKIYDISLPVRPDMVIWPDSQNVNVQRVFDQENGDTATVSTLTLGIHTGTHLDAPLHFVRKGNAIEALELSSLCGPALVYHALDADFLTADCFEKLNIPSGTERLLIRTRNSSLWRNDISEFNPDYVAVSADGAQWLVKHKIKLIGVDYLSVAPFNDLVTPHEILLQAGIIPLEGLDLSQVESGLYMLYCLPLKLVGVEGAPARTILIKNERNESIS
jgi:arylformamidase